MLNDTFETAADADDNAPSIADGMSLGLVDAVYGALPAPLVIVVAALLFAAWRQGAYYGHQFAIVECAVGAAAAVAGVSVVVGANRRQRLARISHVLGSRRHDLRRWAPAPAVAAAAGLAATTAVSGILHHHLRAASPTFGILAAGAVVASLVATSSDTVQQTLVAGLMLVGAVVAAAGWWGVATHRWPWSLVDGGLWRAASTITYANATAAICVPLALVALSQLAVRRSAGWSLATTMLLTGAAATLSRAGALGFVVGLAVLLSFRGVAPVLSAAWPAMLGATLAAAGLANSLQAESSGVASPAHLGLAGVGAAAGLGLSLVGASKLPPGETPSLRQTENRRGLPWRGAGFSTLRVWLLMPVLVVSVAGLVAFAGPALHNGRLSVQSPDRTKAWQATWDLARSHPWAGVGPGPFAASWTAADGEIMTMEYTHNEYLQLGAQQGVLGETVLLLGLGGTVWVASRRRPKGRDQASAAQSSRWAGAAAALSALAVHSGFDFLWHIPLIPLIGAALAGIVLAHPRTEVVQ